MSDARTKLRAFAPAFLEVIEELQHEFRQHIDVARAYTHDRVSGALSAAGMHMDELARRIAILEAQPLPADVRVLSDRIDTLVDGCNSHTRRIENLEAGDVENVRKVYGQRLDMHVSRLDELERKHALLDAKLLVRSDNDREEMRILRERIEALERVNTRERLESIERGDACPNCTHTNYSCVSDMELSKRIEALERSVRPAQMPELARTVRELDDTLCKRIEALEAVPTGEVEAFKRGRESLDAVTQKLVLAARAAYACHLRLPSDVVSVLRSALEPFGSNPAHAADKRDGTRTILG